MTAEGRWDTHSGGEQMADPPIRVIPTSFQQVLDLLTSEHLRSVERAIAAEVGMRVVEDYSAAATSYAQAEMSVSGMTASDIEALLRDRRDRLVAFGVRLLRDQAATHDDGEYPEGEEQDPGGPSESVGLAETDRKSVVEGKRGERW